MSRVHGFEHVLIVGGGASGVLMAAHLLRLTSTGRVTLIEKSELLGCGVAYATDNPDHLLNTRVQNMSAFPDDPEHFLRWLHRSGEAPQATPNCFVGRLAYGRYLESLIADRKEKRLRCVRGDCLRLETHANGIQVHLKGGASIRADAVILATGHAIPSEIANGLRSGWDFTPPQDNTEDVVIIGTGLSMVDHAVSLIGRDHRGKIVCFSRRALLPRAHKAGTTLMFEREDVPVGAPVSRILLWLRQKADLMEAQGGTWRDVVDGFRPHISTVWQDWTLDERRRFLRHAASWWEVHRHRMPPQSAELIAQAQARGQLQILKARFDTVVDAGPPTEIRIVTQGGDQKTLSGHVIDCRGIRRNPETDSVNVVLDLIAQGLARIDCLRLGLDTTKDANLLDKVGRPSERLFAIGPCARGALWEITAIPDIRVQCARLAANLAARAVAA